MSGSQQHLVLVADALPIFGRGMVAALNDIDGIDAELAPVDQDRLVAAAVDRNAQVVVIGLGDESGDALGACTKIRRRHPGIRVVIAANPDMEPELGSIVRAGATGMFARSASIEDAVATVEAALSGRSLLAPEVASQLMGELAVAMRRADARSAPGGLTARELDVLRLVADGLPNRDVAQTLHISENTVKNHMRSVHEKLGVRTRTEAVVTATRDGLLA